MASDMDAEYLQRMLGDVLAQGCAAVAALRPDTPVEALAAWLQGRAPTAFLPPSFCRPTLNPHEDAVCSRAADWVQAAAEGEGS